VLAAQGVCELRGRWGGGPAFAIAHFIFAQPTLKEAANYGGLKSAMRNAQGGRRLEDAQGDGRYCTGNFYAIGFVPASRIMARRDHTGISRKAVARIIDFQPKRVSYPLPQAPIRQPSFNNLRAPVDRLS
jgi:hypothetical protein